MFVKSANLYYMLCKNGRKSDEAKTGCIHVDQNRTKSTLTSFDKLCFCLKRFQQFANDVPFS